MIRRYNSASVSCTVDTSGLNRIERDLLAMSKNPSKPLKVWINAVRADINKSWRKMTYGALYSVTGFLASKEFRKGIKWRPVRPMYGRLTDGDVIPPWGGVARLDGRGKVQGRKRPSGARVKSKDIVGQDTKAMARDFTSNVHVSADKRTVSLITNVAYAKEQNRLRPFNKVTSDDRKLLKKTVKDWISERVRYINSRRRGA